MAEDSSADRGRYRGLSAVPAVGIGQDPEKTETPPAPELLHAGEQGRAGSEQGEPAHRQLSGQRIGEPVHAEQHHEEPRGLPGQIRPTPVLDRRRALELEWLRSYIEHNCILRLPPDQLLLTNYDKGLGTYQYFTQIATLDQEFMQRCALLFWADYLAEFRRRPFQLCGCETGGVQIVCALQALAYRMGI